MAYEKSWGGAQPGCLILLVDQSGSMSDPFGAAQPASGQRKSDAVATVINGFLNELIGVNTTVSNGVSQVRPRAEIALIGYSSPNGQSMVSSLFSGTLAGKDFVNLSELDANPVRVEMREVKELDSNGSVIKTTMPFPVWISPKADGGTPMYEALIVARDLACTWAGNHPDCYPPVIINVTDGKANGDLEEVVGEITQVSTRDGCALFFNVHITDLKNYTVEYPASESELPDDLFAKRLFFLSSIIPDNTRSALESLLGRAVPPQARGMVFNGDATSVRMMFTFASAPARQMIVLDVDPSR